MKGRKKIGAAGKIVEDIVVYDAAKVQFFVNFLRRFFLEPVDMYDCLTMAEDNGSGHVLLRRACEEALEESFAFLKVRRVDKYRKLEKDLADLPSFKMKTHKGLGVGFDSAMDLFMGAFPMEREASGR